MALCVALNCHCIDAHSRMLTQFLMCALFPPRLKSFAPKKAKQAKAKNARHTLGKEYKTGKKGSTSQVTYLQRIFDFDIRDISGADVE
jgi:hypothetical protein